LPSRLGVDAADAAPAAEQACGTGLVPCFLRNVGKRRPEVRRILVPIVPGAFVELGSAYCGHFRQDRRKRWEQAFGSQWRDTLTVATRASGIARRRHDRDALSVGLLGQGTIELRGGVGLAGPIANTDDGRDVQVDGVAHRAEGARAVDVVDGRL